MRTLIFVVGGFALWAVGQTVAKLVGSAALSPTTVTSLFAIAWFLAAADYYHGDFYERAPLSLSLRQPYMHRYAPMREIGQYMNREHPGSPVFLVEGNEIAAFNADVYTNGWH